MTGHILEELEHIFLFHERHLTVDLRELGLTVCAQVLITETLGNLEVTVETTDHQQLLQGLGRLRQCIELSWVHTRRHHKVTGTLWGRTNQNRRFYLDEVLAIQEVTNQDRHTVTQFEVLPDSGTTKVEITILHTDIVATIGIVLDGERRRLALTEDIQFLNQYLNITRRHLGILALTLTDHSLHLDTELTAQFIGLFTKCCIIGLVEHQLCQTIAVAQINESHTTHLTAALNPSCQRHLFACIGKPKLSTSITSIHIYYVFIL